MYPHQELRRFESALNKPQGTSPILNLLNMLYPSEVHRCPLISCSSLPLSTSTSRWTPSNCVPGPRWTWGLEAEPRTRPNCLLVLPQRSITSESVTRPYSSVNLRTFWAHLYYAMVTTIYSPQYDLTNVLYSLESGILLLLPNILSPLIEDFSILVGEYITSRHQFQD